MDVCARCGHNTETQGAHGRLCDPVNEEIAKYNMQYEARSIGTWGLKAKIINERGNRCEQCGAEHLRLEMHHILPVSKGGKTVRENILLLCHDCHAPLTAQLRRERK